MSKWFFGNCVRNAPRIQFLIASNGAWHDALEESHRFTNKLHNYRVDSLACSIRRQRQLLCGPQRGKLLQQQGPDKGPHPLVLRQEGCLPTLQLPRLQWQSQSVLHAGELRGALWWPVRRRRRSRRGVVYGDILCKPLQPLFHCNIHLSW